jgi:hypothetical protein
MVSCRRNARCDQRFKVRFGEGSQEPISFCQYCGHRGRDCWHTRSLNSCRRSSTSTRTRRRTWPGTTPRPMKMTKSRRSSVGQLGGWLLYLPTYSPWLNPAEMLWRHFCREVTHCELFESIKAFIAATLDFPRRCNAEPAPVLSIIGSNAA